MPEIRPDLDVLARFVERRLAGIYCLYATYNVAYGIECGNGFWISEFGTLVCGNHMVARKEAQPTADIPWIKVVIP